MERPQIDTETASAAPARESERAGIQSVEVAATLLRALADAPSALALKDLAGAAGMTMSKAHRYLVSLARAGLVDQDAMTGRYDLGALALRMGLTALGRTDAVRFATEALVGLRDAVGETAVLAIWGERGATVIRFEEGPDPVRMNVRVGSVLPVGRSSIGQTFAAHLPRATVAPVLAAECADPGVDVPEEADYEHELADIRARGLAGNAGTYIAGVSVMAAPVFDHGGTIVAVIGVLAREPALPIDWHGPVARALKSAAEAVSHRLGAPG